MLGIAALATVNNAGVLSYWARQTGVLTRGSLATMALHGIVPVFGVALGAFLAWGLGRRVSRFLGLEPTGIQGHVLAFAFGLGVYLQAATGLGFLGFFRPEFFILAACLVCAAAWPERGALSDLLYDVRKPRPALGRWKAVLAALMAYAAFDSFVRALAPPIGWDATAYHLVLPKLYLEAGGILEIPWMKDSYWPHLIQVFYGVPMAFGHDTAAAVLHALLCGLLVLAVFIAGHIEESGKTASACAWIAAALLAGQPILHYVAAEPRAEGALAFFHFLACLALWRWSKTGSRGFLAAGGLMSGLAAASKMHGLVLFASLALWVVLRAQGRAQRLRAGLVYSACAAAIAAPWYFKTFWHTGNPVWPFYWRFFGGGAEAAVIDAAFRHANGWRNFQDIFVLARYGPQYLLLPGAIAAALAAGRRSLPPFMRFLWWPALPLLLLVGPTREVWRYLFVLTPAMSLSAAWWIAVILEQKGWRRPLAALLLAFGVSPILRLTQNNQIFAVLGLKSLSQPDRDSRALYLERSLDYYRFYQTVNARIRPGERVLLFREVRGYYLDVNYRWGEPFHQRDIVYKSIADGKDLARRLESLGFTHVLVHDQEKWYGWDESFYDSHTLELMRQLLSQSARLVVSDGPYALYALKRGL
jgi:hypothetical protein